jgi:uncharacterized protein
MANENRWIAMARAARSLGIVMLLCGAVAAHAIDLNEAKRTGLVGETTEGYVDLVNPAAPAEVRSLVDDVNARRRAEYERIARNNGISREEVEVLAAIKAIERTEAGGWVRVDGVWRTK